MPINFEFDTGFTPHTTISVDGLNLHARDYGAGQDSNKLPLVCLAGLTRNSIDFHALALHFAKLGRRVIALDSRGRGKSDYDPNWQNYNLGIELNDALTVLASLNITKAIFIGTSRGGMMTMLLASFKPDMIAGAVLNDIGPVLEVEGLRRIQSYVGQMAVPSSYDEAIKILKFISNGQFSGLSEDEWQYFVRTTWAQENIVTSVSANARPSLREDNIKLEESSISANARPSLCEEQNKLQESSISATARPSLREESKKLKIRYDLSIAQSIQTIDLTKPIPDMWAQFEALKHVPVLSLRGEHSDLFSIATQQEMSRRHPACASCTVAGQAHAPLLADEPSLARIQEFVENVDKYNKTQI
jgi:pimeloyl-ACP methyl ester carboxylesterase